jgi:NitT/TauT family transport system ATP-binding protein
VGRRPRGSAPEPDLDNVVFEEARSVAIRASTETSAGSPLVRVTDVTKAYKNGYVALRGVSLTVQEGEFVALVGPSGCGKSTLLRIIAGLGEYSSGEVTVGGLTPARSRKERQDIAFVFQDPTLLPWMTVERNVALPLELRGVPLQERQEPTRAAIAQVGLQGFEKAYPRQLSGGMRMRVSIARALVTRPRLLLLDEPFGALDEITRQRLNDELIQLYVATGVTIVFVTHNVFEASFLASRILVMTPAPGRISSELVNPVPYPRESAFRGTAEFSTIVGNVIAMLRED